MHLVDDCSKAVTEERVSELVDVPRVVGRGDPRL